MSAIELPALLGVSGVPLGLQREPAAALLHQNLQHAFRPIRIGSGLLAYQDQAKKQAFLRQWDAETRPLSE